MACIRKNMSEDNSDWPSWVVPVCLSLILVFGFFIRIEDMRAWQANPERAFYEGEPLLTNYDGYYYLRIARDLVEDNYHDVDPLRITPDHPKRSAVPPLLSVIAATVHETTNISFNWIGVFLPPVLGVLLVFPLYGLGRCYGGPLMGLVAALAGIISYMYFVRTSVGWFDTDCLNVTLSLTVTYFFLRFGLEESRRRYLFFFAGVATWVVFLWWWDMARPAVTIISMIPLGVALLFYYRPARLQRNVFFLSTLLALIVLFVWQRPESLEHLYFAAQNLLHYVTGKEDGLFPNVSQLVAEQRDMKFVQIVATVTDSYPVLLLGLFGIFLLFYRQPKKSLFLLAPFLLSCLAVFLARRFLIFLGPIIGLGLGYLVVVLWRFRYQFSVFRFAVPVLVLLVVGINIATDFTTTQWPKFDPRLVCGFKYIEKKLPKDAVIWAWWDWGHPLIYWSKRAAISDGAAHDGELSVYNAIPYATSSPRLAANLIKFHVIHGRSGFNTFYEAFGGSKSDGMKLFKRLLSAGPISAEQMIIDAQLHPVEFYSTVSDWLLFLFPPSHRQIYFFLDYRLGSTAYWWYWLGTWDISTREGVHSRNISFYNINIDNNGASDHKKFFADFEKGEVLLLNDMKLLKSVSIFDITGEKDKIIYQHDAMAYLEIFKPGEYAALQRKDISESMFNRLFLRHEKSKFFRPVKLQTPMFQIYQVVGDTVDAGSF